MLSAGYMEDWRYFQTYSGTPQGGVISPLLANIYLHELDKFVENELIPACTAGSKRRHNPAYQRATRQLSKARAEGDRERARELTKQRKTLPSSDLQDPTYRRLRYVRYADDILLGFTGPKREAEEIKRRLAEVLRENLRLGALGGETLITHATTEAAVFSRLRNPCNGKQWKPQARREHRATNAAQCQDEVDSQVLG